MTETKKKPWTPVDLEQDRLVLWEQLRINDKRLYMEEIGEGSSFFENHIEFWGTWRVNRNSEVDEEFLEKSENWPKDVEIIELEPG